MTPVEDFLLTRRSRSLRHLEAAPTRAQIDTILTAGSRVPDHGKLEPWRFVVLEKPALTRIAQVAESHIERVGAPSLAASQYTDSPFAVVVLASPRLNHKIPVIEQTYSTGAVCVSVVNAALAAGLGAVWLSGMLSHDATFAAEAFGAEAHESVAGIIHIGTCDTAPSDRPRPDLEAKTTWMTA